MIPFWKKTGKHSKPQSAQKRRQNAKPAVPRTAQQSIPMQRMQELRLMQCYLMPDEIALRELSEGVIEKLKLMTDAQFAEVEFPMN